ncbi:MAG: hypothetical protein ACRDJI_05335, partial [Actinomycetota bacterium]
MRDALGHAPRIHENERRAVFAHMTGDQSQDLRHLFGRGDSFEFVVGKLERQIEPTLVSHVDDRAAGGAVGIRAVAPG